MRVAREPSNDAIVLGVLDADAVKKMTANGFRRLLVALPWLVFVTYS